MTRHIPDDLIDRLSEYVAGRMGLFFPKERRSDLERGLKSAAAEFGFSDAESCARWLLLSPLTKSQVETLASHLTVGETYFFRDTQCFTVLEGHVFPELIRKRRDTGRSLRVWSAGCATGEEPYSLAMLLARMMPDIRDWNITILATDINPSFLRKASSGIYGEWSFRDVPSWVKDRYFRRSERGRFEILPQIKGSVTFSYLNLAEDAYPSLVNNTNAIDVILCRNVLMYFTRDHQKQVVEKLHRCLVDDGLLIVSPAEISPELFSSFHPGRFHGATIYQKGMDKTVSEGCPAPPSPFMPPPSLPGPVFEPPFPAGIALPAEPEEAAAAPERDLYQEALACYAAGRYADTEEKITALLADSGNDAPALALLARVRANAGRLAAAREACEGAMALDKLNPGRHYLHATILQEMGFVEEAVRSLKRALYLDQNFVLAHFNLGSIFLRLGKNREAERHLENARSVLSTLRRDALVPESEGVTAGRMEEIIAMTLREAALT
jgi:chemotaxis protein methyltransferase CheR